MPRRSTKPQGRPSFATTSGARQSGFSAMVAEGQSGGAVVTMLGELDLAAAPELQQALDEALAYDGGVEIDMRACGFVDSRGIAAMVSAARKLAEGGEVLRVKGAQERVRQIFELAGLLENDWIELET
jgi:anti-sigma B factor antagonist